MDSRLWGTEPVVRHSDGRYSKLAKNMKEEYLLVHHFNIMTFFCHHSARGDEMFKFVFLGNVHASNEI